MSSPSLYFDKCSKLRDRRVSLSNKLVSEYLFNCLSGFARPLGRRHLATVQDTPVRRYGGLKDQDRIFTNAYSRHDHGIKGALVRFFSPLLPQLVVL